MSSVERITALWEEGERQQALAEARAMLGLASDPDLLRLWEVFGSLANTTSDPALAEELTIVAAEACEQLYRAIPRRYPLARIGLASWYLKQKRFQDARSALEWGIRVASTQKKPHPVTVLELYRRLSEVAWAEGNFGEQAALLEKGLDAVVPGTLKHLDRELAREVESVRATLARAREELGDTEGAARIIEEKIGASRPATIDDAIDLVHLAELRVSQRRFETARDLLRRALRISDATCELTDPRRGRWVAALARIDESAGRTEEARAGFHRAYQLLQNAQPPPTTEELGELQAALKRNTTLP